MRGVSIQSVSDFLHLPRPIHGHERESLHYTMYHPSISSRLVDWQDLYVPYTFDIRLEVICVKECFTTYSSHEYFLGHSYAVESSRVRIP